MSSHHDTSSKLEIATHASLPLLAMLFIQMYLNHFFAPPQTIFISPYMLAFLVVAVIGLVALWKGQICPGQRGRLLAILPFLLIFALGNLAYSVAFTPKHSPAFIVMAVSILLPVLFRILPDDEQLKNVVIYCGLAMASIGILQYLLIYWYEIPSLFNGIRANNFAQLLLGILLAGWYLILAKSRLEGFLKLLVLVALIALIFNYSWTAFVLYQQLQIMPDMVIFPYFTFFAVQFVIFTLLAWLLLGKSGKNIKNPTAWTAAMFLAMLFPFTNIL